MSCVRSRSLPKFAALFCSFVFVSHSQASDGEVKKTEYVKKLIARYDDALPYGVVARLGTNRYRFGGGTWTSIAVSPDGKAVAFFDGNLLVLRDVKTGKLARRPVFVDTNTHLLCASCLAFSPNGKRLAVQAIESAFNELFFLRVWNLGQGVKQEWGKLTQYLPFYSMTFSPDGKQLLATGVYSDSSIVVRDAETGRVLKLSNSPKRAPLPAEFLRQAKTARLRAVLLSPNLRWTLMLNGKLWDLVNGIKRTLPQSKDGFYFFAGAFAADGTRLAILRGGFAKHQVKFDVWDVANGKKLATDSFRNPDDKIKLPSEVDFSCSTPVAFSKDGKTLLIAFQNVIHRYDIAARRFVRSHYGHDDPIIKLRFTTDGSRLLSRCWKKGIEWNIKTTKDRELSAKEISDIFPRTFIRWPDEVRLDGRGSLILPKFNEPKTTIKVPIILAGFEYQSDHEERFRFSTDKRYYLDGPFVSKKSRFGNHYYRLWDLANGNEVQRFPNKAMQEHPLALSPDRRLLVLLERRRGGYSEGPNLVLRDVATGTLRARLPWHLNDIRCAAFSPDGRLLAAGGVDGIIHVYNMHGPFDGKKPIKPPTTAAELQRHWKQLGLPDAVQADRAIWSLIRAPDRSSPLLKKQMYAVPRAEAGQLRKWIADLASRNFRVREEAVLKLMRCEELSLPFLRNAEKKRTTLEGHLRLTELLKEWQPFTPAPQQLRRLRGLEVLERIGGAEARAIVADVAKGAPDARMTREAQACLRRWRSGE